MLWIVQLDDGKTVGDLHRAAQAGERSRSWAKQLGGPSFALPPRTSNVTLALDPGNYALVCYIGSARENRERPAAGDVPGADGAAGRRPATIPRPDVSARISEGAGIHLSTRIPAGRVVIRVENETDEEFEFKFQRVPAGLTGKQFLSQPSADPGIPWGGLGSVPPRERSQPRSTSRPASTCSAPGRLFDTRRVS